MSYLLADIAQHLVTSGICKGLGEDIFTDKIPDSPDNCIGIFEYTGYTEMPWEPAVHRNVQILCRGTAASIAKASATKVHNLIRDSLDEIGRIDFNERFTQTTLRQTPFKIDEDDKNRVVFGFNMGITTSTDEEVQNGN